MPPTLDRREQGVHAREAIVGLGAQASEHDPA